MAVHFELDEVEEGGEPLQTFSETEEFGSLTEPSSPSDFEFSSLSDVDSSTPLHPIGDLYVLYLELALHSAQPYPGDEVVMNADDCFGQKRFSVYRISDSEYVAMDNETDVDVVLEDECLYTSGFMPAFWYAQTRMQALGLDPEDCLEEDRFLSEIGDVQVEAVKTLLDNYCWDEMNPAPDQRFEVRASGDEMLDGEIIISDHVLVRCFKLPQVLLKNTNFSLIEWYERQVNECEDDMWNMVSEPSDSDPELISSRTDSGFHVPSDHTSMPSLMSVSNSSDSGSESNDSFMPPLVEVSDSLDSESETHASIVLPELVEDNGDPFQDRLDALARVVEQLGQPREDEPTLRSHRLGDLMGSTVAALLDFFQPYPGDESISWADECRESVRFRVLRLSDEYYTIEDSYFDDVTVLPTECLHVPSFHLVEWYARQRARALDIEYNETLPIHRFPIEELLADAVQQIFSGRESSPTDV
jgi:hypothetical protein